MPFDEAFKDDPFQDDFPALQGLPEANQPVPGCGRAAAMSLGI
jgi:hypothetical protein